MVATINGWEGISSASSPLLATGTVPGTSKRLTLRRDVLPLFLAFYADWNRTVLPLDGHPLDGWAYREARTGAGLSNHSSGTAADANYDSLLADHQRHMTPSQIAAVHALLDKYVDSHGRRVFGWGGDWRVGVYCDEMHLELAQASAIGAQGRATTTADVQAVISRLGINPDGTTKETDMPLTPAEIQSVADAVWAKPITRMWDGKDANAASILVSTQNYAIQGGFDGVDPKGSAPTVAKRILSQAPASGGTLSDADVERIAQRTADILAARLSQ